MKKQKNIFIILNNQPMIDILVEMAKTLGHISHVRDINVINLLSSIKDPDLVILSENSSRNDGKGALEVLPAIKRAYPDVPVYMYSGAPTYVTESIQNGAKGYLPSEGILGFLEREFEGYDA